MTDKEFSDLQKKLKNKNIELAKLKKTYFKQTGNRFFGISMSTRNVDDKFLKLQIKIEKTEKALEKLNKIYFKQTGKKYI
jgi:hypothetical protein